MIGIKKEKGSRLNFSSNLEINLLKFYKTFNLFDNLFCLCCKNSSLLEINSEHKIELSENNQLVNRLRFKTLLVS